MSTPAGIAASNERNVWQALRPWLAQGVFVAILLLAWVTLHAFGSLGTNASIELSSGNDASTYLWLLGLVGAALLLFAPLWTTVWPALATRPMVALAVWLGLVSIVSEDRSTSLHRFVLTALVFAAGAALMPLAGSQARLARLLAVAMGIVLALSYGGVILVPDLAIHQITDLGEPDLAGDWRGVFGHKNDAAAVFSQFVFMGLFVARSGLLLPGLAIVVSSAVFVVFAGGKSALALLGLTLLVVAFWRWRQGGPLRLVVALAPVVVLNGIGVGGILVPALGSLVHALPIDATFTGRTDVWAFAIDNLSGHWLLGHGFDAFWNTASTRFGGEDQGWAGTAAHAHNSFLDTVVSAGLPGLALALIVFVVQPLRDVAAAEARGADPALLTMLAQVWLFGLYLSGMETIFFDRNGPIWVTFVFAVLGLRYAASFRLRRDDPR